MARRVAGILMFLVISCAALAVGLADDPAVAASNVQPNPPYRKDRILVKPRTVAGPSRMAALHTANGCKVQRVFEKIGGLQVIQLPQGASVPEWIARYRKSGLVEYAEPDYLVRAHALPNDPYFQWGSLWGLNNTGQNGGKPDADIDAPEGWDTLHDAPEIVVAVIDTGIRETHEELAANMWVNPRETPGNNIDDDGSGYVDDLHGIDAVNHDRTTLDDNGHGTHVAGTIGAAGNNGKGIVGVAWRVKIMACKSLDSVGRGSNSGAIECIDYARMMGADVMNASWGGEGYSDALRDAIASARDAGVIFVASAGNGGDDRVGDDNDQLPQYPASYDLNNIISVAATDRPEARKPGLREPAPPAGFPVHRCG